MISDPTWEEILTFLKAVPQEQLLIATIAIGMAKHFALMGLHTYANFLSSPQIFARGAKLPPLSNAEQRIVFKQEDRYASYDVALDLPPLPVIKDEAQDKRAFAHRVIFSIRYDFEELDKLPLAPDLTQWLLTQAYNLQNIFWTSDRVASGVLLKTPLGFQLSLSYLD